MDDGAFQWDDAKAAANLAKHGVTFEAARGAFRDAFALEWSDDAHEPREERYSLLGMVEGRVVFVAYTMRGDAARIVSARLATPFERRMYHEQGQA